MRPLARFYAPGMGDAATVKVEGFLSGTDSSFARQRENINRLSQEEANGPLSRRYQPPFTGENKKALSL